jgi:hypothetical protein
LTITEESRVKESPSETVVMESTCNPSVGDGFVLRYESVWRVSRKCDEEVVVMSPDGSSKRTPFLLLKEDRMWSLCATERSSSTPSWRVRSKETVMLSMRGCDERKERENDSRRRTGSDDAMKAVLRESTERSGREGEGLSR